MRFLFGIAFLFFGSSISAQELPLIWSTEVLIPDSKPIRPLDQTFSFEAPSSLPGESPQKFIEIRPLPGTKLIKTEIVLNGAKIQHSIFQQTLIPIDLLPANNIRIKISGPPGDGVSIRVVALEEFEVFFGPIELPKQIKPKTEEFSLNSPAPGEYIMSVEVDWPRILTALFSEIEINGTTVINLRDLIHSFKGPVLKAVQLQSTNQVKVHRKGFGGLKVAFLKDGEFKPASQGKMSFRDLREDQINVMNRPIIIDLDDAQFSSQKPRFFITKNNVRIFGPNFQLSSQSIIIPEGLTESTTVVEVYAEDTAGNPIRLEGTFKAGDRALSVRLTNIDTSEIYPEGIVTLEFDDSNARMSAPIIDGVADFFGVPGGMITARGESNGDMGAIKLDLKHPDVLIDIPISPPTDLFDPSGNSVFARLLSVPVTPEVGVTYTINKVIPTLFGYTYAIYERVNKVLIPVREESGTTGLIGEIINLPPEAHSITVTFNVSGMGSSSFAFIYVRANGVDLGFRNITDNGLQEITVPFPNNATNNQIALGGSFGGLAGSVPSLTFGTIRFDISSVTSVKLTDFAGNLLTNFSVDANNTAPNLAGRTYVNGSVKIQLSPGHDVSDLFLEVYRDNEKNVPAALGFLSESALASLNSQVGQSEITIEAFGKTPATSLFVIPKAQAARISSITNATTFTFKVAAQINGGGHIRGQALAELGNVELKAQILSWMRIAPDRIFGDEGASVGGDKWARPRTKNLLNQWFTHHNATHTFPLMTNDISKMHGGSWDAHSRGGHKVGIEVDFWIPGFPNSKQIKEEGERPGAEAAENLMSMLNQLPPGVASQIEIIYVTMDESPDFVKRMDELKAQGYKNWEVIQNLPDHWNHFHVRFKSAATVGN